MLGVEEGGLQSAEALLFARYFMYSQLYFHPIRRIYDIHLRDFLKSWLSGGEFPTNVEEFLKLTDNEIMSELAAAAASPSAASNLFARRITTRDHFRLLYQRNPDDIAKNPDAAKAINTAAETKFGPANVRFDKYTQKSGAPDFPVWTRDGRTVSSLSISSTLNSLPLTANAFVFIEPSLRSEAEAWLNKARESIIMSEGKDGK